MGNPHIGSNFDEFLKEEGIHEEVIAAGTILGHSTDIQFNSYYIVTSDKIFDSK
jgi:predicted nucleic-acid-binding Zn-ribbon protein